MVEKRFAFDLELFSSSPTSGYKRFFEAPVSIGERFLDYDLGPRAVRNTLIDTPPSLQIEGTALL